MYLKIYFPYLLTTICVIFIVNSKYLGVKMFDISKELSTKGESV